MKNQEDIADLRDTFARESMSDAVKSIDGISRDEAAELLGINPSDYTFPKSYHMLIAKIAYSQADAMLWQREK